MSTGEPDSGTHGLASNVGIAGGTSSASSSLSVMDPPVSLKLRTKDEPDCDMERNIDSSVGGGLASVLSSFRSASASSSLSVMDPPASIILKTKDEPDCDMERSIDSSVDGGLVSVLSSFRSASSGHNEHIISGGRGSGSGCDENLSDNSESTATTSSTTAAQLLENLKNNLNNNNNANTVNNNTTNANSNNATNNNNNNNTNRKLFECDVCNMKFSNGANMRRHKMRHTGVKPYECRVCQKRFFRKDHLAEHFTTHTKTLPYHCPICNRGFQRQIAMRAHFQNEHVGQHDLVKTCPLCSYRAGTMKSLRVHFFNRHGIDLDNPGPGTPSSLLLALDQHNPGNLLPALAAMNAFASDSGESMRSVDNVTPPMHFLTPHVEISMADNNDGLINCSRENNSTSSSSRDGGVNSNESNRHNDSSTPTNSISSALDIKAIVRPSTGGSPSSPHSADSNAPYSSHGSSLLPSTVQSSRHIIFDNSITPSISLIPIKQVSVKSLLSKLDFLCRKLKKNSLI